MSTCDGTEMVGAVVRTRTRVNPVYVSAGHRIDLPSAIRWTLASCAGYRIPEPSAERICLSTRCGPLLDTVSPCHPVAK